jgi:hypothetical protein
MIYSIVRDFSSLLLNLQRTEQQHTTHWVIHEWNVIVIKWSDLKDGRELDVVEQKRHWRRWQRHSLCWMVEYMWREWSVVKDVENTSCNWNIIHKESVVCCGKVSSPLTWQLARLSFNNKTTRRIRFTHITIKRIFFLRWWNSSGFYLYSTIFFTFLCNTGEKLIFYSWSFFHAFFITSNSPSLTQFKFRSVFFCLRGDSNRFQIPLISVEFLCVNFCSFICDEFLLRIWVNSFERWKSFFASAERYSSTRKINIHIKYLSNVGSKSSLSKIFIQRKRDWCWCLWKKH